MLIKKILKVVKRFIKIGKKKVKQNLPHLFFNIFSLLPVRNNLAVFESYRGESFSGNPKYILMELKKRTNIKCVVFVNEPTQYEDQHEDIFFVKRLSISYIYWLARAKYVVNNVNYPDFLQKRKGTYHVQTMHGTPLKLMGVDLINKSTYAYKQNLLGLFTRSKRWDLLVSPNSYTSEIFKRVFKYRGEVLECGYPRNDILVNNVENKNLMNSLKVKLGLDINKKVVLFAPTWRESSSLQDIQESLNMNFETLQESLSDEYVVVLRLHHLVSKSVDITKYKGFLYDLSKYSDSQELLIASDVLVTDYSSIMFDYLNYKKDIILYLHDYDDYMTDRGAYFDVRKFSPGNIAYDFDELLEKIINLNDTSEVNEEFFDKFCHVENGIAAEKVVDHMLKN